MGSVRWALLGAAGMLSALSVPSASGQCENKLLATIGSPPASGASPYFGSGLAFDGATLVVGDYAALKEGAIFVFEGSNATWTHKATLQSGGSTPVGLSESFGEVAAVDGNVIAVGCAGHNGPAGTGSGGAFVFNRSAGTWGGPTALYPADSVGGDHFGQSIALDGDLLAVGCVTKDAGATPYAGAVYVFRKTGGTWSQLAKLHAGDPFTGVDFGNRVEVRGSTIVVGATGVPGFGQFTSGAAYVFEETAPNQWTQTAKLVPPPASGIKGFGASLSMYGDRIAIGSGGGRVLVNRRIGTLWFLESIVQPSDNGANFGFRVDMEADRLAVAAPSQSGQPGAIYVYERDDSTWIERMKVLAPGGTTEDYFPRFLALAGDAMVAGVNAPAVSPRVYVMKSVPNPPPEYGAGCPGTNGLVPTFALDQSYDGCFTPTGNILFNLENAKAPSTAILFFGVQSANLGVSGSCSLLLIPGPLVVGVPTLGISVGGIAFTASIPASTPSLSIYAQAFVSDAGAPLAFSATNGVRITIQ